MESTEFGKVWLPLAEAVYRVACYILEDEADAKDAVQDLYLKLWNSRAVDGIRNPLAYAVRLMHNMCIDRLRGAASKNEVPLREDSALAPPSDSTVTTREKLQKVLNLIEGLPPRQRQVVTMRCLQGMEYREIAEATGLSEGNLRTLLSMARNTIKLNL